MDTRRKILYSVFGVLVVAGLYLMIWGPDSLSDSSADDSEAEAAAALSALTGGGPGSAGDTNRSDYSVFENSNLMDAGVGEAGIEIQNEQRELSETGILDPASEGNPINPQTGQPYPDSAMRQFRKLRERFPDNSVIPRRTTPEMEAEEKEQERQMREIRSKMRKKEASPSQINEYYDDQAKTVEDRLELINYVLDNQKSSMSPDIKKQFEQVLEMNQNQLDSYNKQRERALERAAE